MQVSLVAADRVVWSGEATVVIARTAEGEIGILAQPRAGAVGAGRGGQVEFARSTTDTGSPPSTAGSSRWPTTGSRSCAEHAELSHDIDVEEARAELEECQGADDDDEEAKAAVRRAEAASGQPARLPDRGHSLPTGRTEGE